MFCGKGHKFQNLGEGTWYHSGALAIRQAVAAKTNITYKILFNDAVAMTGGQPVDGPVSVQGIALTCRAEGVERIAIASDAIDKFRRADFPAGTTFHDRSDLIPLQRELRDVPGVSVLIYEQTCATEKRRRRKRGTMAAATEHVMINPEVCEGCGDCSIESNCLSVEPLDTELGRKRQINQSSCNQDLSCVNGFCPSFVTLSGATRRKTGMDARVAALLTDLPTPPPAQLEGPFDLLVTGVGGTGVITVGAVITMAAHLEGKGASVLDFTGFAQKFGTVLSYIRLAASPEDIHQVRIAPGEADAVIGCDVVVSSAPKASAHYSADTRMVLSTSEMPTGDLVLRRDADLRVKARVASIRSVIGDGLLESFDANRLALELLGDTVFANVILMGAAFQRGLIPISDMAMRRALELNGVAVAQNLHAFDLGRALVVRRDEVLALTSAKPAKEETPSDLRVRLSERLVAYQDARYSARFNDTLDQFCARISDPEMQDLATRALFKVMAYKDEYEIARLLLKDSFAAQISDTFSDPGAVSYHLAPPFLSWRKDHRGRPKKWRFGAWIAPGLRVLAKAKGLRGTMFDPFGYSAERRKMRNLVPWLENALEQITAMPEPEAHEAGRTVLRAVLDMRGFGPVWDAAYAREKPKADAVLRTLN